MAADSVADTEQTADQQMVIKWHGKEFSVHLAEDDTVGSLKRKIEAETEVAPKRQKLLGLKAKKGGGLPADSVHVSELLLKPGMKVMMMGCAEKPNSQARQQLNSTVNCLQCYARRLTA
jgi:hypothetical protein